MKKGVCKPELGFTDAFVLFAFYDLRRLAFAAGRWFPHVPPNPNVLRTFAAA